jgi:hypothetical protein
MKKCPVLCLVALAALGITATVTTQLSHLALAWVDPDTNPSSQKAPIAISGDKVYVVGPVNSKQNLLTTSLWKASRT